jgi:hypothetical protein
LRSLFQKVAPSGAKPQKQASPTSESSRQWILTGFTAADSPH